MKILEAIGKLSSLFARLSQMATGGALPKATEAQLLQFSQTRFSEDVEQNFNESRDPNGNPWAPLKWRVGKPLILTGNLMRAAVGSIRAAKMTGQNVIGFGIQGDPKYWEYQNYGTSRIPARWFYFPHQDTLAELTTMIAESFGFEILREER